MIFADKLSGLVRIGAGDKRDVSLYDYLCMMEDGKISGSVAWVSSFAFKVEIG